MKTEAAFRNFLDTSQYSRNGILRYERIFGEGFVSTGGLDTTQEFISQLDLKPGQVRPGIRITPVTQSITCPAPPCLGMRCPRR